MTDLYTIAIPPMMKALAALDKILDKATVHAATYATERRPASYFEDALLQSRLIFDQFPLVRQIQIASDNAKGGAARLAGVEPPKYEDVEKTIAELQQRIKKTLDFLKTIQPEQIIGQEERKVSLPYPYFTGKYITGFEYTTEYLLPNFYFHVVTAYSILRKSGVALGKTDYIGGLPLKNL
ncbi:hypothetical protein A3H16_00895 [Candidatus Kaiserbacteria bacterium RIFCSPLOWO2_12_FULL_53_8]|uniref:DUF1993 domain-containing protein n=2 Tax=Candidatus Kaiseribacteriota TaxID=1752734 RepID=A0A1F6CUT1_9BACT|nr:MAG: hypothetical protein A2851_04530 [Candidatus Kaiserbacteria bacterium RIFCSPHIGHO2_01_FULL_53_29]OGG92240.1 MAG: hypothetical protein A3H16_00895 [Candidatus Kaiserbacteria bacterium RIFCSPLOWO2_12_FULL_53_8]